MKYLIAVSAFCGFLALQVIAQQTPTLPTAPEAPDFSRHDKYASDAHAYCLNGPPLPNDEHGHACTCKMVCVVDETGEQQVIEQSDCEMWCSKQRCTCHVDQKCPSGLMPMDPDAQPIVPKDPQ